MDVIIQLRKALEEEALNIRRRGVTVDDALGLEPLEINAPAPVMARACLELIKNSVRFNRAGGKLYLWRLNTPGQKGVVIADTGIGMPPQQMSQLKKQAEQDRLHSGLNHVWHWLKASGGDWLWESQNHVGFQISLTWPETAM